MKSGWTTDFVDESVVTYSYISNEMERAIRILRDLDFKILG